MRTENHNKILIKSINKLTFIDKNDMFEQV